MCFKFITVKNVKAQNRIWSNKCIWLAKNLKTRDFSKGHEAFELEKNGHFGKLKKKTVQFIMFKDLGNFLYKLKMISFNPIFPKN